MKEMTRKSLVRLAGAAALLLLCFLIMQAALALNWPPWAGVFLVLLVLGLCFGAVVLSRLWVHHRERQFADTVIEAEIASGAMAEREPENLKELKAQWKKGIKILCRSHLKRQGNPLYVLPWYLVLGASGTGKTACLSNCGLASHFLKDDCSRSNPATRNCEWWLFDGCVVIDTAGRYTVPDGEADKQEWRTFLRLLIRSRKREPLNGIVVTVSTEYLLRPDTEALASLGRLLRRRIDQLMRGLGARFPVYVLVTKCDLIDGFWEVAEALPAESRSRSLGAVNHDLFQKVECFIDGPFADLMERLRNLRLYLLRSPEKVASAGLLKFPESLAGIKGALSPLLEAVFGATPYQETPVLRGIFFSSAKDNGSPATVTLAPASPAAIGSGPDQSTRGLFLHDLFARTLPDDRSLWAPTRRATEWRRITDNLGLVAWAVAGIALCGILTFSFVRNLSAVRHIANDISPLAGTPPRGDIAGLIRFRQGILAVEERNRRWWVPRFGLTESLRIEDELKRRFCRQFHDSCLASFDAGIAESVGSLSPASPDRAYAAYVLHLARRIHLLKGRLKGKGFRELQAMPQPVRVPSSVGSLDQDLFAPLYLSYLSWYPEPGEVRREVTALQGRLKELLEVKRDLQWALSLVEMQGKTPAVTLAGFWGGSRISAVEPTVAPAFTRKGRGEMLSALREIESALADRQFGDSRRVAFETSYRRARLSAWGAFADGFPRGVERLSGEREWQETASRMATDDGPYFALLKRMALELGDDANDSEIPRWLSQLNRFQVLGRREAVPKALGQAADGGRKLIATLEQKVGNRPEPRELGMNEAAQQALREYRDALAAIVPALASQRQAYQAATLVFGEEPGPAKSPFWTASVAVRAVASYLANGSGHDDTVTRLVTGPLDFLLVFARKQTAGYLQNQWEEQVLAGALGLSGAQATPLILGPDGLVWKFVKGPAAPFLSRTVRGYRARQVLGGSIPFADSFFQFLERGNEVQAAALTRQPNYLVGIQGLPTDTNPEARIRPHATRLELQCGGGSQTLANLNYPVGKTFNWSPENCGDVQLQIEVGDLVLTRSYPGAQGFPQFLQSFRGGQHTFTPRDFPGERAAMERIGIRYVRIAYHITGSDQVIKQGASAVAAQIPRTIARGWGN